MPALAKSSLGGLGVPTDFIAVMTAQREAEERRKRQQAAYLANMPQTGEFAETPAPTRVGKVQDWVQSGLEGLGVMPKRAAQLGGTAARLAELGGLGAFDEAQYGRPGEALESAVGGPVLPAKRLIKTAAKELAEHLPNVEKTASAVVDPVAPKGLGGIRAYHGSPHSFEEFDISKIGTGEGHQAYGHGLYFAEKEGIARSYKEGLTVGRDPRDDVNSIRQDWQGNSTKPITADSVSKLMQGYDNLRPFADDKAVITNIMRAINGHEPGGTVSSEAMFALKALDKQLPAAPTGHMYEVDIAADPEAFLDWDKPLSEQPEGVRKAVESRISAIPEEYRPTDPEGSWIWRAMHPQGGIDEMDFSQALPAQATERLKQAGIPGIKYLDAGSRAGGLGSRNYVVFDPKIISIVKKYGLAAAISAGLISEEMGRQMQQQGDI